MVCFVWFGIMVAAFVVAIALAWRQRVRGIIHGLAVFVGGLLTGAFVSATIGLGEIAGYATTPGFWISLIIGVSGLGLFHAGVEQIGRREARDAGSDPDSVAGLENQIDSMPRTGYGSSRES